MLLIAILEIIRKASIYFLIQNSILMYSRKNLPVIFPFRIFNLFT